MRVSFVVLRRKVWYPSERLLFRRGEEVPSLFMRFRGERKGLFLSFVTAVDRDPWGRGERMERFRFTPAIDYAEDVTAFLSIRSHPMDPRVAADRRSVRRR